MLNMYEVVEPSEEYEHSLKGFCRDFESQDDIKIPSILFLEHHPEKTNDAETGTAGMLRYIINKNTHALIAAFYITAEGFYDYYVTLGLRPTHDVPNFYYDCLRAAAFWCKNNTDKEEVMFIVSNVFRKRVDMDNLNWAEYIAVDETEAGTVYYYKVRLGEVPLD